MSFAFKDRVKDTSTTTGTGNFTLANSPPLAYQGFSTYSVNDTFYYVIENIISNEWEVGLGTYSSSNTLTRTTVLASSNSGALVNFSAGSKNVEVIFPAQLPFNRLTIPDTDRSFNS